MRRVANGIFPTALLLLTTSCGDGSSDSISRNVIQVNAYATADQRDPRVAMLAGGAVVVAWTSAGQDGDADGVFARLFSSTLQAQTAEFRVNVATAGSQVLQSVAPLENGGFVVAWTDTGGHVLARRYDGAGEPNGQPFEVQGGLGDTFAIDGEGRFVVAERDTCETYHYGHEEFTCITGRRTQVDGTSAGASMLCPWRICLVFGRERFAVVNMTSRT